VGRSRLRWKITTRGNRLGKRLPYLTAGTDLASRKKTAINPAKVDTLEETHSGMASAILICFNEILSVFDECVSRPRWQLVVEFPLISLDVHWYS
jgi:hypothetical protein